MRRETIGLLRAIEAHIAHKSIAEDNLNIKLEVLRTTQGPNIRFHLTRKDKTPYMDPRDYQLYKQNPIFPTKALRKTEQVAMEAWAYLQSRKISAEIEHLPLSLLE